MSEKNTFRAISASNMRLRLSLVVFVVCSLAWGATSEAGSTAPAGAWLDSPDRVLSAWGDVTAGKGGVVPSIGLEYGGELDRFILYGKAAVTMSGGVSLSLGAGLSCELAEWLEVGYEASIGSTQSHLWCKLEVNDWVRVGLEKGLLGRYDACSVTYSLSDSLDLSVYIGNNNTYWTRVSVNL